MKKKLLALLLAGAMVMGLSVTAMAADLEIYKTEDATFDATNGKEVSKEVNVKIKDPKPEKVYYVAVNWDSLDFTYDFGSGVKWNPEQHSFEDGLNPGWVSRVANIIVTNHSNAKISIKALFAGDQTTATVNNVKATLTNNVFSLESGVGRNPGSNTVLATDETVADNDQITVTLDDTQPTATADFKLTDINLTITPVN